MGGPGSGRKKGSGGKRSVLENIKRKQGSAFNKNPNKKNSDRFWQTVSLSDKKRAKEMMRPKPFAKPVTARRKKSTISAMAEINKRK